MVPDTFTPPRQSLSLFFFMQFAIDSELIQV